MRPLLDSPVASRQRRQPLAESPFTASRPSSDRGCSAHTLRYDFSEERSAFAAGSHVGTCTYSMMRADGETFIGGISCDGHTLLRGPTLLQGTSPVNANSDCALYGMRGHRRTFFGICGGVTGSCSLGTGLISGIFSPAKHKILYVFEKNEIFFKIFLTIGMIWIS